MDGHDDESHGEAVEEEPKPPSLKGWGGDPWEVVGEVEEEDRDHEDPYDNRLGSVHGPYRGGGVDHSELAGVPDRKGDNEGCKEAVGHPPGLVIIDDKGQGNVYSKG